MPALSAAADNRDRYEPRTFKNGEFALPDRLLMPKDYDRPRSYPLVVFLHGAGERGNDNQAQLVHGLNEFAADEIMTRHPAFVVAPQCPSGQRWVEVDWTLDKHDQPQQPSPPLAATLALIGSLQREFSIDERRIYITGLSMGGFGVWDALARKPELFAAAAPVCGGADLATAPQLKAIPVWAFHGERDSVVKPHRSRDLIAALKAAGGTPKYTEYSGVGHDCWTVTYRDPAFYEWLFAQRRP
jgi:predicted peptidase